MHDYVAYDHHTDKARSMGTLQLYGEVSLQSARQSAWKCNLGRAGELHIWNWSLKLHDPHKIWLFFVKPSKLTKPFLTLLIVVYWLSGQIGSGF
jgi:hypothetical protein